LSSFKILSILALEFGERGVRGEGKTGEFKEFTLLIGIFLEEQSGQHQLSLQLAVSILAHLSAPA